MPQCLELTYMGVAMRDSAWQCVHRDGATRIMWERVMSTEGDEGMAME